MKVWLGAEPVKLEPSMLIGQGGEAEVFELADGRVLKLFKQPDHPDLVGLDAEQRAAAARLADHQAKLRAFPPGLPDRVVTPRALATSKKLAGDVVGYAMAKVGGDALFHYGEPRWRRDHAIDLAQVTAALIDLYRTLTRIHAAGVIVGDLNDLNILVDGERAWVIDADSFQWARWRCAVFSERFVDPRLCDPPALVPVRPHDPDSDWFAYAVMVFRSLLGVGPYGGVHQPADPARRVLAGQRALRGVTVLDPDVIYPRAALSCACLPEPLRARFEDIFARGRRGRFPIELLTALRWVRCARCGADHARAQCPTCRTTAPAPAPTVRGAVRATALEPAQLTRTSWTLGRAAIAGAPPVWIDGATLWRRGALGVEAIGQVLAGHTRAWVGASFGLGFYRAGAYTVGFTFRPDRRGLDDRLTLPRWRGHLLETHAAVGDDRAWLSWREIVGGQERVGCAAIGARGEALAVLDAPAADAGWLDGARGAIAIGALLFVPTDAGVVRVEVVAGALSVTRTFPDTAELVASCDQLFRGPRGLDVQRPDRALRLEL